MDILLTTVICLICGGLVGFIGGVLGIGGGLIAIPALGLILGMPQQLAQGTGLIMVLPTIIMAVRKYHQQVPIDKRVAMAGAAGAILSTWFGAHLALGMDSRLLRLSFAVFLGATALFYVWQTWQGPRVLTRTPRTSSAKAVLTPRGAGLLGILCGMTGGFFGVGGAVLAVPIITSIYRLPQTTAQALALSMVIPGSMIALITYAWGGQTNVMVGLPLAVGSLICVPLGVRLAYRLPEKKLRACFALMLFATVALLIFEA